MSKKILVIDDDPEFLDTMSSCLKSLHYDIVLASNGKEGLNCLKNETPDLILLDLIMPVMSGSEFYKIIKSDSRCQKIPVLIVTGREQPGELVEPLGDDEFISKPVDLHSLGHEIETLISKSEG